MQNCIEGSLQGKFTTNHDKEVKYRSSSLFKHSKCTHPPNPTAKHQYKWHQMPRWHHLESQWALQWLVKLLLLDQQDCSKNQLSLVVSWQNQSEELMTKAETFYQGATGVRWRRLIYDHIFFFFLGQSAGMRPAASCRASDDTHVAQRQEITHR